MPMELAQVRIDLIINGAPSPLAVAPGLTIGGVIRAALRTYQAQTAGRGYGGWREWEIRLGTGELLALDSLVREHPVTVAWWMNLIAGVAA